MGSIVTRRLSIVASALTAGLLAQLALVNAAAPPSSGSGSTAPKADLAHAGPKVQMNQGDFKVNKRAAIAHKPHEMKDPKTGKALDANASITLANGKKMTASSYFAQLNALEKKFNAIGHTLHGGAGQKVVLHEAIMPKTTIKEQTKKLAAKHAKFNAKTMRAAPKLESIEQTHAAATKLDAARMASLAAAKPDAAKPDAGAAKTTHNLRNWNHTVGKQSLIAAFLSGKLETTGTKDGVKLYGEVSGGGYLMNHRMALLEAKSSVEGPHTGAGRATLSVRVMGQSVYNVDKSSATAWNLSKTLSKTFDYGTKIHFSIGPIPVSGRLGARGSAGVRFALGLRPAHATAQIVAKVAAKVYAQVGVDVSIASAGVGGEVTLIQDELTFGGEVGVDVDPARGPYISEHFYALNYLRMLAGRFYLYARVNYLVGHKQYDFNLWNSTGIKVNGYLFNVNNRTYLYPNYTAPVQGDQGGAEQK